MQLTKAALIASSLVPGPKTVLVAGPAVRRITFNAVVTAGSCATPRAQPMWFRILRSPCCRSAGPMSCQREAATNAPSTWPA